MIRLIKGAASAAVLVLAACGTPAAPSAAGPSSAESISSPINVVTPSTSAAQRTIVTPVPPPPFYCTGDLDYQSTARAVNGGSAAVLIEGTVSGDPVPSAPLSARVPVTDVDVLAGRENAGEVVTVTEPMFSDGINLLTPGRYIMLLRADSAGQSDYALVDGYEGTFVRDGDLARQRCPDYTNPGHPLLAQHAVSVDVLSRNASRAIAALASATAHHR